MTFIRIFLLVLMLSVMVNHTDHVTRFYFILELVQPKDDILTIIMTYCDLRAFTPFLSSFF